MKKLIKSALLPTILILFSVNASANPSPTPNSPSCGFSNVWVNVQQIQVNVSGNGSDWQTLLAPPQKVDLLSTSGVFLQLGQAPIPTGQYQQIRLVLAVDGNTIVLADGTEVALTTPSSMQSGYKILGSFTVPSDTAIDLVLNFDACHSIVQTGNGSYILKPVVRATPTPVDVPQ